MFNVYSLLCCVGDLQDCMYKFKAKIEEILNKDEHGTQLAKRAIKSEIYRSHYRL